MSIKCYLFSATESNQPAIVEVFSGGEPRRVTALKNHRQELSLDVGDRLACLFGAVRLIFDAAAENLSGASLLRAIPRNGELREITLDARLLDGLRKQKAVTHLPQGVNLQKISGRSAMDY